MIWTWPSTADSHDPVDWVFEVGDLIIKDGKEFPEFFKSRVLIHTKG